MPKDFTDRTLHADQLRDRWAHHVAAHLLWAVIAGALALAGIVVAFGYERYGIGGGLFVLSVLGPEQAAFYHLGASRTITRIAFGGKA